ncbi:VOC family protein [Halosimplex aquaticum]|uniref:VOC family protein n=1 Tax=Halosimplex aquaticum TaxID=3026162 RepID=A0ABD5XYY1_9EURY|nr:VOC family protein [Halosimplex aquaticum]
MTDESATDGAGPTHPHAVGHVHLKVRDLERALAFYRSVLGLDVTEREGRYVFLSWGERHHDVALQEVGAGADGPGPGVGLYHVAFEVEAPSALAAVFERLRDREVQVSPVDHGISKALYFADPDGNGIEVYLDTRESRAETAWRGRNERFDPTELA